MNVTASVAFTLNSRLPSASVRIERMELRCADRLHTRNRREAILDFLEESLPLFAVLVSR